MTTTPLTTLQQRIEKEIAKRIQGTRFRIENRVVHPWTGEGVEVTFKVGDVHIDIMPEQVDLVARDLYRSFEFRHETAVDDFVRTVVDALFFFLENREQRDGLLNMLRRLMNKLRS